jgi:purine-nucleoside phosphorylase
VREFDRAEEAARFVAARTPLRPAVGVVLGSGLGAFADSLEDAVRIPYDAIPHFAPSTAVSHSGQLVVGRSRGVPIVVMAGRVHHYEGYTLQQVVRPVRALARFGLRTVVMTNAAGSVNARFQPGDLMVIRDHINFMGGDPLIGPQDERLGERFVDMSDAYDARLRERAAQACRDAGITVHDGVYIAFAGPSFETPAEIELCRRVGADAVGMSTVPEVIAARQMGLRVLGLSCITNMAAGVLDRPLDYREVLVVGEQLRLHLLEALGRIVAEAAEEAR